MFVLAFYKLRIFHANQTTKCLRNQGRTKGEGWSATGWLRPPINFIAGRPKAALLVWFFVDFRCGVSFVLSLFLLCINYIEIYKNRC